MAQNSQLIHLWIRLSTYAEKEDCLNVWKLESLEDGAGHEGKVTDTSLVSLDDNFAVSTDVNGSVILWSNSYDVKVHLEGHTGAVRSVSVAKSVALTGG